MAVAALVIGILGILLSLTWFSVFGGSICYWGVPLSLVALALGLVGRKRGIAREQPIGLATAGLVLGVVGAIAGTGIWGAAYYMHRSMKMDWEKAVNDPAFRQKLNDARLNKDFDDAFNQALGDAQKQQAKAPAAPAAK